MSIQKDATLDKIMLCLSRNDELLEKYAIGSTKLSSKDKDQIINIQLSLVHFLQTFQQSILTPLFIGAAKYHCHSLNLLFIIICWIIHRWILSSC